MRTTIQFSISRVDLHPFDQEYSTLLEVVEHLLIVVGDRLLFMEEQYQYTALHLLARVNRICVYILCLCSLITGEERLS